MSYLDIAGSRTSLDASVGSYSISEIFQFSSPFSMVQNFGQQIDRGLLYGRCSIGLICHITLTVDTIPSLFLLLLLFGCVRGLLLFCIFIYRQSLISTESSRHRPPLGHRDKGSLSTPFGASSFSALHQFLDPLEVIPPPSPRGNGPGFTVLSVTNLSLGHEPKQITNLDASKSGSGSNA